MIDEKVKPGTVQFPADLLVKAKTIATHSDQTVSEVVADAARPAIERRYRQTLEKLSRELGGEG